MSAEGQVVEVSEAPVVEGSGPREIVLVGQEQPAEAVQPKPEVQKPQDAGLEEGDGDGEGTPAARDENGRFKKQGTGVQDRIDELTRARREAEREAEYWRVRAQGTSQPQQPSVPQKPVRENFADEEQYIEALADYKVNEKLAERDAQNQQKAANQTKAESWNAKLAAARAEITDFDTVMANGDTPVAGHVAELIMEHDHGAKLAYHLAARPEIVEKLNQMTPAKAAFEIGKITATFDTPSSKPASAKVVSNAPPPAARNVGAGKTNVPDPSDMSMEEYKEYRKKQGAWWA